MLPTRLRVLLVEDDDDHADLVASLLEGTSDPVVTIVRARTVAEGVKALHQANTPDRLFGAVLTDQNLPDSEYWETVPRLVEAANEALGGVPVIALTSIGDLDVAVEALSKGAQDYVVKSEMTGDGLQRTLRYALERSRHATDLRTTNAALRRTLDHVRQMQAQIVEQEKLAGLGRLLGGVAHELRNPLHLALNYATAAGQRAAEIDALLPDTLGQDATAGDLADLLDDLQENTRKVIEHTRRSDAVIRAMFEHVRGVGGTPQRVEMAEAVDVAVHQLSTTHPDLRVRWEGATSETAVHGVPPALARLIYNVLENAALAVASVPDPEVCVSVALEPGAGGETRVAVEVKDNGIGIAPESLPHLFEPFFTSWADSSRQMGLGLALAHNIVTSHGGRIDVRSAPGRGTSVRIVLPAGASAPAD